MINKFDMDIIAQRIQEGEEMSPFLFLGQNTDLLNCEVEKIAHSLLEKFEVPRVNVLTLGDNGEKIKIKDIKEFVKPGELGTPYKFQIFLIENISRMTLQSFNSCLKFFEEPGIQNIIFLTNASQSGVIDTIISRVQIIDLGFQKTQTESNFYFSLLQGYLEKESTEIFSYFFRNKLEKSEYTEFLRNMIMYSKKHGVFLDMLEEIDEDIKMIEKNNVNGKAVVDKYLLRI